MVPAKEHISLASSCHEIAGVKQVMKQTRIIQELDKAEIIALSCKSEAGNRKTQQKDEGVRKDSPIYKLDARLEEGSLRVGGRIHRASLPVEVKYGKIGKEY